MLAGLKNVLLFQINRPAGGSNRFTGGVQQRDGNHLARRRAVRVAGDEFVQDGFQPVPENRAAKLQPADDGAEGVGDGLGAFPQAVLAASRTRTCSSTCHATTSTQTPSRRP